MKGHKKNRENKATQLTDEGSVASTTECTGLMPSKLEEDDKINEYQQIYHIPGPADHKKNNK